MLLMTVCINLSYVCPTIIAFYVCTWYTHEEYFLWLIGLKHKDPKVMADSYRQYFHTSFCFENISIWFKFRWYLSGEQSYSVE